MWTQNRLQSDQGLHCLTKRLLKYFSRELKQTTFVVIGTFRVYIIQRYQTSIISYCLLVGGRVVALREMALAYLACWQDEFRWGLYTGGKPRNYHEIVLTYLCSQATSGTRRGSFQAENWTKKGWDHFHFCFILQLRTNNGEIRRYGSS